MLIVEVPLATTPIGLMVMQKLIKEDITYSLYKSIEFHQIAVLWFNPTFLHNKSALLYNNIKTLILKYDYGASISTNICWHKAADVAFPTLNQQSEAFTLIQIQWQI